MRTASELNGYFYISVGTSSQPGWRGLCFHNEQWGQGYNCDGDAGQSCGMGLWGQYASNEITGCPSNKNGYWNDMGPNDCVNADVCVQSGQETLTLTLMYPRTSPPTTPPTMPPSMDPTPMPTPLPSASPTMPPTPMPTPM